MDYRLELVAVPVSDVDRAKAFYVDQIGFVADPTQTYKLWIRLKADANTWSCRVIFFASRAPLSTRRLPRRLKVSTDYADSF